MARKRGPRGAAASRERTGARRRGRLEGSAATKAGVPRVSRLRRPEDFSLEAWQVALRRQYGRERRFRIRNLGEEPVFSEFEVTNPESGRSYRVAIRGDELGVNYCSCPDFAVNTLGTCKHIECLLHRLRRSRQTRAALIAGFRPADSEIYVHYGPQREVRFRAGSACPSSIAQQARRTFDARGVWRQSARDGVEPLPRAAARRRSGAEAPARGECP